MPLAICLKVAEGPARSLPGLVEAVGRVIGRDDLQVAERQRLPQRLLVGRLARGGLHIHLAPSRPGLSRSCAVRNRYCGQVSANTLSPSPARRADHGRALGRRDVEDHDRLVDQRRHRDQPGEGLGLGDPRMAIA